MTPERSAPLAPAAAAPSLSMPTLEPHSPAWTSGTKPRSIARGARGGSAPAAALPPVRAWRASLLVFALVGGLVVAALASAGTGQLHVPLPEVLGSFFHHFGLDLGPMPTHPNGDAALWNIRFPRVTLCLLVGAALGASGAVMQGVFRNPLADPGVIGVSSGAAVGACTVIVFGWTFFGIFTIAAAAFVSALFTTLLIYVLSQRDGKTEVVTLVLMGIAVQAVCGGLIGYLVFLGDTASREQIVFWQLGSFNGSRWDQVAIVAPFIGFGLVGMLLIARKLDLLALGEHAARHLGVNVERVRLVAIVAVTLSVAAAVAFSGIIGFVGLVVPHLVRMLLGPSHRTLVPASAIGGALVLTVADLVARTAVDYAELPIGMLTALIGGPFFFWLLMRARRTAGGWA
ncbi:MAG: FecCD family ABC transporter permease [Sporichthyaceae bacterium]